MNDDELLNFFKVAQGDTIVSALRQVYNMGYAAAGTISIASPTYADGYADGRAAGLAMAEQATSALLPPTPEVAPDGSVSTT